jgi:hypothetical protein
MAQTLLARKSGPQDNTIAKDDDHHEQLAADPTVSEFPQNSNFDSSSFGGSSNAFSTSSSGPSAFGSSSAGGFGSSSSFDSPASNSFGSRPLSNGGGFGGNSSFGAGTNQSGPTPNLTAAGSNAAQGADVLVANDNTDWINKKWRPVMGWVYMLTCTVDFVLFPVLWSLLQALSKGSVTSQWQPLTLQGAGLYHIAMGAVLGIAAYGRTKEKIEGKS